VNMRLNPGGIREMHWHKEAEWAYMLAGHARITAVNEEGCTFIDDVGPGDLWNFPAVIPHSIQGLDDGCEFLLVFDDGSFSENETFLLTDLFAHMPREVLAKNFGVPESAFADIPVDVDHKRYIFEGQVQPLADDTVRSAAGTVPQTFSHRMMAQKPIIAAGGWVRITDSTNFPAASTIAAALVHVEPGAMRELHWHATAAEWAFVIEGGVRTTVIDPQGYAETNDFEPGDLWYFPRGHGHMLECLGNEPCHFILIFDNGYFSEFGTFSITDWFAHTPKHILAKNFGLPESSFAGFPKEEVYFARGAVPPEPPATPLQGRTASAYQTCCCKRTSVR